MRTTSTVLLALVALSAASGLRAQAPPTPTAPTATQTPTGPDATPGARGTGAAPGGGQGRGGRGPARVPHIPDAPVLPYAPVPNPLPLPAGQEYGVVASVAINAKGHVFVYHRAPVPIAEFNQSGAFVRSFGTANRAHSIRVDAEDHLWVVDSADHTVQKLSSSGEVLLTLGTKGVVGTGDVEASQGKFNIPSDVAIAPNGDIFIAQGEAGGPDPRIIRFDRTGRFLTTWSLKYTEGTRSNPHAIEVDQQGLVYVADREVMRIRVFRPDGTHVRDLQMQNPVCGIFIDRNQQMWIATGADGQMMQIDATGRILGYAGRRGPGLGEMTEAHMLAVAPSGEVYVADSTGRKVEKFVRR